jgi:hypothetical protein
MCCVFDSRKRPARRARAETCPAPQKHEMNGQKNTKCTLLPLNLQENRKKGRNNVKKCD